MAGTRVGKAEATPAPEVKKERAPKRPTFIIDDEALDAEFAVEDTPPVRSKVVYSQSLLNGLQDSWDAYNGVDADGNPVEEGSHRLTLSVPITALGRDFKEAAATISKHANSLGFGARTGKAASDPENKISFYAAPKVKRTRKPKVPA